MSATALSSDLRAYAVKRWPTANHKFRKARLADLLGLTERRVRSYWEAKAASPRDDEVDAIKALIGQKEDADAADIALAERIAELEAQVAFLVSALAGDELAASGAHPHKPRGRASGQGQGTPGRRSTDRH